MDVHLADSHIKAYLHEVDNGECFTRPNMDIADSHIKAYLHEVDNGESVS